MLAAKIAALEEANAVVHGVAERTKRKEAAARSTSASSSASATSAQTVYRARAAGVAGAAATAAAAAAAPPPPVAPLQKRLPHTEVDGNHAGDTDGAEFDGAAVGVEVGEERVGGTGDTDGTGVASGAFGTALKAAVAVITSVASAVTCSVTAARARTKKKRTKELRELAKSQHPAPAAAAGRPAATDVAAKMTVRGVLSRHNPAYPTPPFRFLFPLLLSLPCHLHQIIAPARAGRCPWYNSPARR